MSISRTPHFVELPCFFTVISRSSCGVLYSGGAMDSDDDYVGYGEKGMNREELVHSGESSVGGGGGKQRVMASEASQDPLAVFGSEIMLLILSKLDARSVGQARLVCCRWMFITSSDYIWAPKCDALWAGKVHIPRTAKARGISKFSAYLLSVMDGKRTRILQQDLCDHVWDFHFNGGAPDYWKNLDPYWTGVGNPMRRYFHRDGSVSADEDDRVWAGHESCYTVVTGLLHDGTMREHYVRINRWLKLSVRRKENWGWELSSGLCSYNSIPDVEREEGTGPSSPLI